MGNFSPVTTFSKQLLTFGGRSIKHVGTVAAVREREQVVEFAGVETGSLQTRFVLEQRAGYFLPIETSSAIGTAVNATALGLMKPRRGTIEPHPVKKARIALFLGESAALCCRGCYNPMLLMVRWAERRYKKRHTSPSLCPCEVKRVPPNRGTLHHRNPSCPVWVKTSNNTTQSI